ncbi:MAG: cytochrome oxidase putative small subunit CydP [Burkholderiaceae bacterium]
MTHDDHRLLRHLVIAVVVKLLILGALWWFFFRDSRVTVDAESSAQQLGLTPSIPGAKP